MIETGLIAAAIILTVALIMIIKGLRDRARLHRHHQLEHQARIQSDRLREQRAQNRLRAAETRTKRPTLEVAAAYTPRHQARNVTHTRTPGTDLGVTTNPAHLYGATGTTGDTSTTSTTGDCGTTGSSSSSSSSSSSYDGGSSSCDSGGSF